MICKSVTKSATMKIKKFDDLDVWKQSRALALLIYKISQKNQISRDYRFTDQGYRYFSNEQYCRGVLEKIK
jgi:hypothetical protein